MAYASCCLWQLGYFIKLRNEPKEPIIIEEAKPVNTDSMQEKKIDVTNTESIVETPTSETTISQTAQKSAELDRKLKVHFQPILELMANTMRQYDNGELDEAQQRQAVTTITERYLDLLHESYTLCQDLYPDFSLTQAQLMVADSPIFVSVTKQVDEATRRLSGRISE